MNRYKLYPNLELIGLLIMLLVCAGLALSAR